MHHSEAHHGAEGEHSEQAEHSLEKHADTGTEASNGEGTAESAEGNTQDRPILDGSTEDYAELGEEVNPRYGQEDPGLIRHPETGEKTPTPEGF